MCTTGGKLFFKIKTASAQHFSLFLSLSLSQIFCDTLPLISPRFRDTDDRKKAHSVSLKLSFSYLLTSTCRRPLTMTVWEVCFRWMNILKPGTEQQHRTWTPVFLGSTRACHTSLKFHFFLFTRLSYTKYKNSPQGPTNKSSDFNVSLSLSLSLSLGH